MRFVLLTEENTECLSICEYNITYKIDDELTGETFIIRTGRQSNFVQSFDNKSTEFFRLIKIRYTDYAGKEIYKPRSLCAPELPVLKKQHPEYLI